METRCHVVRTREEAQVLGMALATLFPDPCCAELGLQELLYNAIEHGNLEIGGTLKAQLLREHRFEAEIERRLDLPRYADRRVRASVSGTSAAFEVRIEDDGAGFDWRSIVGRPLEATPALCGRGIALTLPSCLPGLEYIDPGNVVILRFRCP